MDDTTAERMQTAARELLGVLSASQRSKAQRPFDDVSERGRWYYTPNERAGLPLAEMDPVQQRQAHRLIGSGLSPGGYATAATIMGWENINDAVEGWSFLDAYPGRAVPSRGRDPQLYYITVFGEPGSGRWGWRLGGHHLALHYALEGERVVSTTPTFFGADPAEIPLVGASHLRPLAGEQDLALELVQSLNEAQLARALLSPAAPPDVMQSNRPRVEDGALPVPPPIMMSLPDQERALRASEHFREELGFTGPHEDALRYSTIPRGLRVAEMDAEQHALLGRLVQQYLGRMPSDVAAEAGERLGRRGLDSLHLAWAGALERGRPHYYRLQGERFLVEYDCVQRNANHIHAVWRDPGGDFAQDPLAEHYAAAH